MSQKQDKVSGNNDYLLSFGSNPSYGDRKRCRLTVDYASRQDLEPQYKQARGSANLAVKDAIDVDSFLEILPGKKRAEYCIQMAAENLAEQLVHNQTNSF